MAEGKFSKPRNRFQDVVPGTDTPPTPAKDPSGPRYRREEPVSQPIAEAARHTTEEEAMDRAFDQVREEEHPLRQLLSR